MKNFSRIRAAAWPVLLLSLTGCGNSGSDKAVAVKAAPPPALELGARDVARAQNGSVQPGIALTGQIDALQRTTLQSEVAAAVDKVLVREGEPVKAGQLLVVLSAKDLDARLKQAEAGLASARAQSVLAESVRERNELLRQQQYLSDLDQKRGIAEAQAAAENVKAQAALLTMARKALDDSRILSPMNGVVSRRRVEPGQSVGVNAPLLDIVDLRELELKATIPADRVALLQAGQGVSFHVSGYPQEFQGTVTRINPVAESGSRAISFYARVPNPGQLLRAGLFVQGRLLTSAAVAGTVIPVAALRMPPGQPVFVLVVSGPELEKRPVTVLARDDGQEQAVVSGVKAGEQVVTVILGPQALDLPVRVTE